MFRSPNMSRIFDGFQIFFARYEELAVFGIRHQNDRPLSMLNVNEWEESVIYGHHTKSNNTYLKFGKIQGTVCTIYFRLSFQSPSSNSRKPSFWRVYIFGMIPPNVCKWPQRYAMPWSNSPIIDLALTPLSNLFE